MGCRLKSRKPRMELPNLVALHFPANHCPNISSDLRYRNSYNGLPDA